MAFLSCEYTQSYLPAIIIVQTESGFYYVLQIEIDLLLSGIRHGAVKVNVPTIKANEANNTSSAAEGRVGSEQSCLTEMKEVVFIEAPVNPEAITRIWLAKRDANGGASGPFINVQPPIGAFGS